MENRMSGKEDKRQVECLYPGDYRVCVLLGKQKDPGKEKRIRWSRFVFGMEVDGGVLLFHTLTKKLLIVEEVPHGDGSVVQRKRCTRQNQTATSIVATPHCGDRSFRLTSPLSKFPPLAVESGSPHEELPSAQIIKGLYEDWFIVPEEMDESKIYLEVKKILVVKEELPKGITHYVILPTTTCNARCFYCFEQGMQYRKMSRETVEDVLHFIVEHKPKDRKQIHIHWFGGEPMCAADNIDRICEGLDEAGIEYTAEMTSNGSLFDEESAKRAFEHWKVSEIQITLDGMAEEYAARKRYTGLEKPFEAVIRNIHLLVAAGIKVKIRLNTDEKNTDDIYRVTEYLKEEFTNEEREKMRIYAHSLFSQEGEGLDACPAGTASDALEAEVQEINDHLVRVGLTGKNLDDLFNLKSHYCMVTSPECNVLIDSSGKLFACDAMPESMRYGDVKTGIDPEAWKRVAEPCSVREECRECVFLPQCTEFDRCPNRTAYDDCYKQEKRKMESDLRFAYSIYLDQKKQKEKASVSD